MQKIQTDILWLFGAKGTLLLANFVVISITLDLLSTKIYGVWITLYTTISWLSFFDLGLGNGMRNLFAVNRAIGNQEKNKQLVSTSYIIVLGIALILLIVGLPFVYYADIARFFNISDIAIPDLRCVLSLLVVVTSLQLITKLINSIFLADQKPALSSLIDCSGVVCSLLLLFILKDRLVGSLFNLALIITLPTFIISFIVTLFAFNKNYRKLKPSMKYFNLKISNKLINLGLRFFLIQLSALIILQGSNIIILKFIGAEEVSVFSLVYKYFNVIVTVFTLVLTPYWSFFTDSYAKNNYNQLKQGFKQLLISWLAISMVGVVMWIALPFSFKIWLNQELDIPAYLPVSLLLFSIFSNLGSVFIYFLNGTSSYLNFQLVIVLAFAALLYPLSAYLLPTYGVLGVVFTMFFANSYGVLFAPYLSYKVLKRMKSN
ncbi:lipopolysaccharide biosynthesis protein [Macellibacteroides fermentans]|jgi:O-antigen/teichoic acid export membrane protein|uniref:O-antigen/teichoic acid export membrane protein n=1 Tax=Macellibacteroides fermentans TaxID=879969 RepID=A0A8E2A116_9PORP|nr:MATE family efflux transporter [Macellibacteroides fermentans]NYI49570.1 O-antigen/teichoic acid export membrane protein [Macellibacteroides fermentans]